MPQSIRDAIYRAPLTAAPSVSVPEAIALMQCDGAMPADQSHTKGGLVTDTCRSCVLVLANQRVVGIVTDRDWPQWILHREPLDTLCLQDIMTPVVMTLPESMLQDGSTILNLLYEHHLHYLPIVDDQHCLVGLLTRDRLQHTLLQEAQRSFQSHQYFLERRVDLRTHALHAKAEREKILLELATQIRSSLNLKTILATTVEQVRQVIGCDRVNIWRLDAQGNGYIIAESTQAAPSLEGVNLDARCLDAYARIFALGHLQIITDLQQADISPSCHSMLAQLQVKATILVPLFCSGELWGILNVSSCHQARDWQPENIELLQALSLQLAIAIQQASAYEQLERELAERKRAESALRQSEARLQLIIDSVPACIAYIDADQRYQFVNQTYAEWFGYSREAIVGQTVATLLGPEQYALCQPLIQQVLAGETVTYEATRAALNQERYLAGMLVPHLEQPGGSQGYYVLITDITDRKQTEAAMRQQLSALEAASDGIAVLQNQVYLFVNQAHLDLFGYEHPDELVGQIWQQLYAPDEIARFQQVIMPQLERDRTWHGEAIAIRKDGSTFFEEVSLTLTEENLLICVCRDISHRKQAEALLQASEAKNRAILATIPDYLFRVDAAGRYLEVVTHRPEITIFPPHFDPIGLRMQDVLPPAIANRQMQALQTTLATGELQTYEQIIAIADYDRYEEVRVMRCGDREALFMVRDITDRTEMEIALRQSERTNRVIVDTMPDLLIQMGRDGYYSRMLGGSDVRIAYPSDSNQPDVFTILPPELAHQRLQYAEQALATGTVQVYEQIFDFGDEQRFEEIRIAPLNPQEVLVIIRDITDRKQAEQQLHNLIEGTAAATGKDFFPLLVQHITAALNVSCAIISELVDSRLQTLAFWGQATLQPNFTYALDEASCEHFAAEAQLPRYCECFAPGQFANNPTLTALNLHSYLSVVLQDSTGTVIGQLCIFSAKSIPNPAQAERILQVFAVRAAAEIERQRAITQLELLNRQLEARIAERTAALEEREARYRAFVEVIPDLMVRLNADGTYLDVAPGSGVSLFDAEAVRPGANIYDITPFAHAQERMTYVHQALATGEPQVYEYTVMVNGQLHCEEARIMAINATEVLLMVRNTTQQKQTEQALHESQQFIQTVVDTVPLPLFWKDRNSCFLGCNWQLAKLLGLNIPAEIVGKTDFDFSPTEAEASAYQSDDRQVMESGIAKLCIEETITLPNGDQIWLETHKAPIRDYAGNIIGVVGMFQDITARKQANQKLQETNEELARATRLKDEFLANMSHELRTPLNAILGMTEALQEKAFGQVNALQNRALKTIERSGSHLLALINDILDVAKIESGQMTLHYEMTPITTLCQSSLAFVKQQALKKRLQLDLQIVAGLHEVLLDERRMRQVLINLLSNAVKFTSEGGQITLAATLEVSTNSDAQDAGNLTAAAQWLRLAVQDTGIGIAEANLQQLFQPFVQVDSALNRRYDGTGLGLALVKRIVELHGGRVGVTSTVGRGSYFYVELPYTPSSTCPVVVDPVVVADAALSRFQSIIKTATILLAEDNEANVLTLSGYLRAKGYQVQVADNGRDAIALAQSTQPQLILMDIQMPEMDGVQAIQQIRQDPALASTPIVALTALAMAGDRERCLAAGADEYLSKPIKLKELVTVIDSLLNRA